MKILNRNLIIFLLLISSGSFAQKKVKPKETSRANIVMLKTGALLVRLKTSDLKINALKSKGMEKEAEEIRLAQEVTNKKIVAAFRQDYQFSKVYFFYSSHSNKIKEGAHKGYLLNFEMLPDSSFTGQDYLVGEFDESQNTQIDAFIIKDKNYVQLKKPFPSFVKQTEYGVSTRSNNEMVTTINENLFDFYNK